MDNTIVKNITSQGIDKTAIKNFAVYARNKLIKDIKNKAAMIGVTESGIQEPLSTSTGNIQLFDIGMQEPYRIEGKAIEQRNGLTRELKKRAEGSTYKTAYETLIEEVAYTWFNRIIAIRFMEVNNYMPARMRVLSSGVEGINEPEFITHVFETNFDFSEEEKERIIELKTDGSNLAMDELFQKLFIKQCNSLNASLPELFEKTNDYTELLLTVSYNDVEGVIYKLVHDVPEANFDVNSENGNGQVEIIGWLYQFYNTEPKATVNGRPKTKKIEKQDIPAATQLFTPEWIVKYMTENSLGRLWIKKLLANDDPRTEKQIADDFGWKYYLPEPEQEETVEKQLENLQNERKDLSVEDITFLDPAMGSFHIGIYAFDVFMQLYESEGYTTQEAARVIVEKNLHGLDIDKRAAQLSYFACLMQARKYNRRILDRNLQPNVYEIPESNHINREHLNYLGNDIEDKEEWNRLKLQLISLLNNLTDTKEYGSLITINDNYEFPQLRNFVMSHPVDSQISLLETVGLEETQKELINIINVAEIISKKYQIVITNPPYMGSGAMDRKLSDFAKKYYPSSKSDMFAMFIEKCKSYTAINGYFSMITQHAWMFISSYEKLRTMILNNTLVNMAHLGARAFEEISGEKVQTTSFVFLKQSYSNYKGRYIKLIEFDNPLKKEEAYLEMFDHKNNDYLYENIQENFKRIPGLPIAYWAHSNIYDVFDKCSPLGDIAPTKKGLDTGKNDLFLRLWYEVDFEKLGIDFESSEEFTFNNKKWAPHDKGGEFLKWYGNKEWVIDWENNGSALKNSTANLRSEKYYFSNALTWSSLTTGDISFRYSNYGAISNTAGSSVYPNHKNSMVLLALLNSKAVQYIVSIISPTLNYSAGPISKIPIVDCKKNEENIIMLAKECVEISKKNWDSFETSWDFSRHPLIPQEIWKSKNKRNSYRLSSIFETWKLERNKLFNKLRENEIKLNDIFIELYMLEDVLDSDVPDNKVKIKKANFKRDIRSLLSYAVGCFFGRYSLDKEGLNYTERRYNEAQAVTVEPRKDNVILITDEEYFEDDIVNCIVKFIEHVYGKETLEENLTYIASALSNNKGSSRSAIRNYFINEFFKDHKKVYSYPSSGSMPIYWLYDSGKQNGFKALVYMHRYDEDTTGKIRVDYLHQVQRAYERTITNLQEDIANSNDAKETSQLQKRLEKVTKQLKECRDYDERLGHMALERVSIDLDDGVKVNYEKVQTDSKGEFHQILAKIK